MSDGVGGVLFLGYSPAFGTTSGETHHMRGQKFVLVYTSLLRLSNRRDAGCDGLQSLMFNAFVVPGGQHTDLF